MPSSDHRDPTTILRIWVVSTHTGPKIFRLEGGGTKTFVREDFELKNKRNLKIQASWYRPQMMSKPLPCVLYLHGNSSSRCEAAEAIVPLLGAGITLVCFDFTGSGLSEGQYI